MYPNIILTNRLQPSAIVTDEDCAACDFNRPGKTCLRQMEWIWKGEHFAASRAEYSSIKAQLESESFAPADEGGPPRGFGDLPHDERQKLLKERLKKYCQRVRSKNTRPGAWVGEWWVGREDDEQPGPLAGGGGMGVRKAAQAPPPFSARLPPPHHLATKHPLTKKRCTSACWTGRLPRHAPRACACASTASTWTPCRPSATAATSTRA